jgi:cobalamin biosynthesis Mg chelatase CobN
MMQKYPEHEKLHKVADESQSIGEFLAWMNRTGYLIGTWNERKGRIDEVSMTIQELLGEYYGIDPEKLNKEKDQILLELRAANV